MYFKKYIFSMQLKTSDCLRIRHFTLPNTKIKTCPFISGIHESKDCDHCLFNINLSNYPRTCVASLDLLLQKLTMIMLLKIHIIQRIN